MTDDELDQKIEDWHLSEDPRPLHEYLGMTWDEYRAWMWTKS